MVLRSSLLLAVTLAAGEGARLLPLGTVAGRRIPQPVHAEPAPPSSAVITGQLKTWHRVTLTFDGPGNQRGRAAEPVP